MATEIEDLITIGLSVASFGVAGLSLFYSRKANISADKLQFSSDLHADDLVIYRHKIIDIYCRKRGDPQALKKNHDYDLNLSILEKRYEHILSQLKGHPKFKKDKRIIIPGDWMAIIKCYKAFPEDRKGGPLKELVEYAKEQLKFESIDDIDPCKQ